MAWTTLPTQSAGQVASASGWANLVKANFDAIAPNVRMKNTADQTVSGTTLTNATGFSFAIGASETWHAVIWTILNINGSSDFKSGWTFPAGATGTHWADGGSVLGSSSAALSAAMILGTSTTTDYIVQFNMTVVNSTTPGTMQFQFAEFAAAASNTIRANAFGIAHRF